MRGGYNTIKDRARYSPPQRFAAQGNQANQHEHRRLNVAHFRKGRTVSSSARPADVLLQVSEFVGVTGYCPRGVRASQ